MHEPVIEVEFTPTPEDVVAVRVQAARGFDSPKMRGVARQKAVIGALVFPLLGALAVVGLFTIIALINHGASLRPSFIAGLVVFVVVWIYQVVRAATREPMSGAALRRLERLISRTTDTSNLTPNLFRLDEEGITHEHDGIVMFFPWESIDRAIHVDNAWYLRASNEMLLRLPDRVVSDKHELDALIRGRAPVCG